MIQIQITFFLKSTVSGVDLLEKSDVILNSENLVHRMFNVFLQSYAFCSKLYGEALIFAICVKFTFMSD